ncbi:MAG: hypothetical protein GWN01_10845 [Nitrosopumilaceae archaeon]|nr:hypothetical protein [Nitrosopumilaceae archaeon]NIU87742.1 hypothetical protein [Nitrosopumilaceae archaeon]NIV66119.1 hypothetical protein [Nitrosopumilaceae archaeon]NIX61986.1 hypothetical protein [Nitrosopumilaceae archaeon]
MGAKTALKLVKKYHTLEPLLTFLESKYDIEDLFPFPPQDLVDYFHTPEIEETEKPFFGKPSPKKIQNYLVDERSFRPERIARQIKSLQKISNQSTLDSFFGG